ncbi:hypothetical protein SKAU_G00014280 [Synaphobranchus kaupii]|uniref:SH3 domain-containing protein n=1 Tax=Synaphobranchus kaupii TaxID=118154 RepID=A0A9Q1GBR9_SYNKA|nr:hypothetical protein SKAU_G00014280 [Synaphobranchus kaupii]
MEQRQEGSRTRKEGAEPRTEGAEQRRETLGVRVEGLGKEAKGAEPGVREGSRERKVTEIRGDPRKEVGGGLVQRVKGVGSESGQGRSQDAGVTEADRGRDSDNSTKPRDRQAGWWYQLMQSSQVYIDNSTEGSKFVKWEKRKKPLKKSQDSQGPEAPGPAPGAQEEGPSSGLRWSRLFGASVGAPHRPEKAEQSQLAKTQKSRLPSGWLSLDKSVLDLMAQTVGTGKRPEPLPLSSESQAPPPMQKLEAPAANQHPLREVRALCTHNASERGQLSFSKGDVLRVLSHAQPDWLLCARGDRTGLVPIIYVTLAEEPQEPQGPH